MKARGACDIELDAKRSDFFVELLTDFFLKIYDLKNFPLKSQNALHFVHLFSQFQVNKPFTPSPYQKLSHSIEIFHPSTCQALTAFTNRPAKASHIDSSGVLRKHTKTAEFIGCRQRIAIDKTNLYTASFVLTTTYCDFWLTHCTLTALYTCIYILLRYAIPNIK